MRFNAIDVLVVFLASLSRALTNKNCSSQPKEHRSSIASKESSIAPIRWAIVALTADSNNTGSWTTSRNQLLARYVRKYHSPFKRNITALFFSEKPMMSHVIRLWEQQFERVATVECIDTSSNSRGFRKNKFGVFGYQYMCRFFMIDLYDYLVERHIEYYWRVDTDCFLLKLPYNIFSWTEDNRLDYTYTYMTLEVHKQTKLTIPHWITQYTNSCALNESISFDGYSLSDPILFFNHFHIGAVSFFRRADVYYFLNEVEKSRFIVTHRWGDAPVQAYAARLFAAKNKLRLIPDLEYVHGTHSMLVNSTARKYEKKKGLVDSILALNESSLPSF
jgi:hypothetical protein